MPSNILFQANDEKGMTIFWNKVQIISLLFLFFYVLAWFSLRFFTWKSVNGTHEKGNLGWHFWLIKKQEMQEIEWESLLLWFAQLSFCIIKHVSVLTHLRMPLGAAHLNLFNVSPLPFLLLPHSGSHHPWP